MSALRVKNSGYIFLWHEGNPYVEVFREQDPIWAPYEALLADGVNYNDSGLKSIAQEYRE